MDLFDELSQQVDNTEDNSTGLLDKDLKDSVLGKRLIIIVSIYLYLLLKKVVI